MTSRRRLEPAAVPGTFLQNSTDPAGDQDRSQQQIDQEHLGCLRFTMPGTRYAPEANAATVQFGQALWWIEAELAEDFSLHSVMLLDLSGQVAQGPLEGTIGRLGAQAADAPDVERWQITIDPSTMAGPPLVEDGDEPTPDHGCWGDGAAQVTLHADAEARVTRIDLALDRVAARKFQGR